MTTHKLSDICSITYDTVNDEVLESKITINYKDSFHIFVFEYNKYHSIKFDKNILNKQNNRNIELHFTNGSLKLVVLNSILHVSYYTKPNGYATRFKL